jgi:hypothetical protein
MLTSRKRHVSHNEKGYLCCQHCTELSVSEVNMLMHICYAPAELTFRTNSRSTNQNRGFPIVFNYRIFRLLSNVLIYLFIYLSIYTFVCVCVYCLINIYIYIFCISQQLILNVFNVISHDEFLLLEKMLRINMFK